MTGLTSTALVVAAPTLLRQGLLAMLRETWPQLLLTLTADATQVAELVMHRAYGLVILDGTLPGRALPNMLGQLRQARPSQRLVVLAEAYELALCRGMAASLHTRFLPRQVPPPMLAATLAPWLDEAPSASMPARTRPLATKRPTDDFSPRELQVLRLVVADYCNDEIADRLYLSVRTVESHRRSLLQKAGTRTLVGLAARAVREGWVA